MSITRRQMLTSSASLAAATMAAGAFGKTRTKQAAADSSGVSLPDGATILLQGDSITDAGRSWDTQDVANNFPALGHGYASLIAAHLLTAHADKNYQIFNRGISGHRVPDLINRWDNDTIALQPDVVSILIGINDLWRRFDSGSTATSQDYENQYRQLLDTTRSELPDAQLVICQPYVLRCGHVNDQWMEPFAEYVAVAHSVAEDYDAIWVPFHDMFTQAVELGTEPNVWAGDGVHASDKGAALMAMRWLSETGLA